MELLKEDNKKMWDTFTNKEDNIPPQYLIKWKNVIEKTYKNCQAYYYLNIKEEIKSVFPFFLIKSRIFGNKLISQPFSDFGGPKGEFDKKFLLEVIKDIKGKFKGQITHIELRLNNFSEEYPEIEKLLFEQGFKKESGNKHQFILRLTNEENLWNTFDRITRKGIKKAKKSELELKDITNEKELKRFYKLYLKNMKKFGSPQHSYSFFLNLLKYLKDNFKGINCYKKEKLIASLISFYTKDYMCAAYNSSEHEYLKYQPNDLLHWEMIRWAIQKGIKYFDFEECEIDAKKGTHAAGLYRFKAKWKGELYERPYFYYYFKKRKRDYIKKKNNLKKYRSVWSKLPFPIIKLIGPKICSELGV